MNALRVVRKREQVATVNAQFELTVGSSSRESTYRRVVRGGAVFQLELALDAWKELEPDWQSNLSPHGSTTKPGKPRH